ncbi:SGNH/GDSL hydrolase family protein [Streptomyces sp. DSM 44917]|uniref:SGNH/GDSL hydrolase family protein n=1 Tax=Streptomyces boetiae TaxID=3075541 RepID=A0ABU2LBF5_9ACTN|nr:SGNH/GDSL hydrolase family protein [Streptomyces sp. DSM 44917]MDT0308916.1 SGNH/GDSL hydrolase family protein [Streptomyces sp. DSM 44917]
MRLPLRRSRLAALVLGLAGLAGGLVAAPAGAEEPADARLGRYVALGDSYASLGSTADNYTDPVTGCVRSTDNYPSLLAERLRPTEFTDATCAGAVTGGVLASQVGSLTPDTDLVTLTIGGNDIGFGSIVAACGTDSLLNPLGSPCESRYTEGGTDRLAETIDATADEIDAVLAAIEERAPGAEVVVVGYLRILPPALGCWPFVPISVGDVPYLNGVQRHLNDMLGARAQAAGATFVNPGEVRGHDACALPWKKWVEGPFPVAGGSPVHPTAAGQAAVARMVAGAL